jgi:hypothetical protein
MMLQYYAHSLFKVNIPGFKWGTGKKLKALNIRYPEQRTDSGASRIEANLVTVRAKLLVAYRHLCIFVASNSALNAFAAFMSLH